MGKATIVSHLGDGKYSVTLHRDVSGATTELNRVKQKLAEVDQIERQLLQIDLDDAQDAVNARLVEINNAINVGDMELVTALLVDLVELAKTRDEIQRKVFALESEILRLRRRLQYLESNTPDASFTHTAWCADRSDGIFAATLSGIVGTIEGAEIAYDDVDTVILKPGDHPEGFVAAYDKVGDGIQQPLLATSPAAWFVNEAMYPGTAKWKPRYRIGTITALYSDDTADVELDSVRIRLQNVNQSETLTGVPVRYMSCNCTAFDVDDRVVVRFKDYDWTQPEVIGFESNPRPCLTGVFGYVSTTDKAIKYSKGAWTQTTASHALFETCNARWYQPEYGYVVAFPGPVGGDVPAQLIITFDGSPPFGIPGTVEEKAIRQAIDAFPGGADTGSDLDAYWCMPPSGSHVYLNGFDYTTVGGSIATAGTVVGAAVQFDGDTPWLVAICQDYTVYPWVDTLHKLDFFDSAATWQQVGAGWTHPGYAGMHQVGWRFNRSGTQARCFLRIWEVTEMYFNQLDIDYRNTEYIATVGLSSWSVSTGSVSDQKGSTFTVTESPLDCDPTSPMGLHEENTIINGEIWYFGVSYDSETDEPVYASFRRTENINERNEYRFPSGGVAQTWRDDTRSSTYTISCNRSEIAISGTYSYHKHAIESILNANYREDFEKFEYIIFADISRGVVLASTIRNTITARWSSSTPNFYDYTDNIYIQRDVYLTKKNGNPAIVIATDSSSSSFSDTDIEIDPDVITLHENQITHGLCPTPSVVTAIDANWGVFTISTDYRTAAGRCAVDIAGRVAVTTFGSGLPSLPAGDYLTGGDLTAVFAEAVTRIWAF